MEKLTQEQYKKLSGDMEIIGQEMKEKEIEQSKLWQEWREGKAFMYLVLVPCA